LIYANLFFDANGGNIYVFLGKHICCINGIKFGFGLKNTAGQLDIGADINPAAWCTQNKIWFIIKKNQVRKCAAWFKNA